MSPYSIRRDDGLSDRITGRPYASYDEAHGELERYYADLCCSDDRVYYRIEEEPGSSGDGAGAKAQGSGEPDRPSDGSSADSTAADHPAAPARPDVPRS